MIYTESTHDTISKLNLNYEPRQTQSNFDCSQNSLFNTNKFLSTRMSNIPNKNSNYTLYDELKNDENSKRINYRQTFNSFREGNDNLEDYNSIEQSYNDINNEINEKNKNVSGFYINEVKSAYTNEKNELILKINQLSKELVDTKTNLGEHIDYLNNQIIDIENKYKDELSELTLKYSEDLKYNSIQNETRIKELESELNVEKEKNEKLQNKLDEYEQTIKNKDNEIEKLNDD